MFDDIILKPKQKLFNIWIQHIKRVGKHSISIIHMISHIKNYLPTNFTAVTK